MSRKALLPLLSSQLLDAHLHAAAILLLLIHSLYLPIVMFSLQDVLFLPLLSLPGKTDSQDLFGSLSHALNQAS